MQAAKGLCSSWGCSRMRPAVSVHTLRAQQLGCVQLPACSSRCPHAQPWSSSGSSGSSSSSSSPSRAAVPASAALHTAAVTSRSRCSLPPHPQQLSSLGLGLSSRSSVEQCSRSVRCHSTPSLNPPSGPVQHISWLQDVQAWCPEPTATTSSSASSAGPAPDDSTSKNGGTTSSTSSSSGATSSRNGSSAVPYQPPRFKQLSDADLRDPSNTFDAIVVLAGGLTPDGGLPEWVHRRMDVARDLHLVQGRRPPILCSGGGTPHKPAVLGATGHIIHESTSGAAYLMATGVQPGAILKETASFDTVGNAYMSLCIHALPAAWRRLAVVTSDFHMPRSRALFADIFRLAGQSIHGDPAWFSLTFVSASDEGVFDHDVYNLRLGKEAGSLAHWEMVAPTLPDLAAFQQWIHTDHLCYAVPRQHEFGKQTIADQRLLDSY